MTRAAQDATQKEVADMLKLDDASGKTQPETQQTTPAQQTTPTQKGQEAKGTGEQPPEEASDNCKVQNVVAGSLPCPQPGEEATHKAVLQELSPEENAGCKEKAAELLSEYNSRCKAPEPLSSDEQKESTDDGAGEEEKGAQQEGETQEADDDGETQKAAPGAEQPPMAVTTSTTTTPHEGYNEIHIVVKVPQEYPQSTTGTTGTTFESAMGTLTGAQDGGSSNTYSLYRNRGVTPKRRRTHQQSLLRRKTMPKHRR